MKQHYLQLMNNITCGLLKNVSRLLEQPPAWCGFTQPPLNSSSYQRFWKPKMDVLTWWQTDMLLKCLQKSTKLILRRAHAELRSLRVTITHHNVFWAPFVQLKFLLFFSAILLLHTVWQKHKTTERKYNNNNNNHFTSLCPGLPGWAGTRRSIHPPTILIIIQSLSASSSY